MKSMHSGCRWEAPIKLSIKSSIILLAAAITGCSSIKSSNSAEWESQLYLAHPLVGKIWSSAEGEFVDQARVLAAAEASRYLLLGEKHDNPDHHRLQQLVVDFLIQRSRAGSIAFEMMNAEAQPRLDAIQEQEIGSLGELKDYLQWDEEGWSWSFYGPLLMRSLETKLPIRAANIDDSTMMQVYGGELDASISNLLPPNIMSQLEKDIDESHCGLLPESQFPAMVRVQQSRDRQMAAALSEGRQQSGDEGVNVLIAGNYHVRADLGVPNYLRNLQSDLADTAVVTISFSEVSQDSTDPADYLQQFSDVPAYDYIWFTPAVSDEDYCASLRQSQ